MLQESVSVHCWLRSASEKKQSKRTISPAVMKRVVFTKEMREELHDSLPADVTDPFRTYGACISMLPDINLSPAG